MVTRFNESQVLETTRTDDHSSMNSRDHDNDDDYDNKDEDEAIVWITSTRHSQTHNY